jgi:SSS family solute:Na+ symporter
VRNLGWENIVQAVEQVHGAAGFDPLDDKGFGVSYVLQMVLTAGIVSCAVWPTSVMRACAAKDTGVVKRLYVWSSIGFMTRFIIPQFLGICALTFVLGQPEAAEHLFAQDGSVVDDPNMTLQAMPVFLSKVLPVGVIGIIGAGMLAAFMSTHDSYLLCWASVFVEDVVNPLAGGKLTDRKRILLARIFIFLIGVFLLVWSIWYPLGQDMWDYLAATAAIYFTGAIALLACGLYWKGASRVGAYLALLTGMLSLLALPPVQGAFGITEANLGFRLKGEHVVLGVTALALILMVVGSLMFPDSKSRGISDDVAEGSAHG